jgi:hypothetical protein
MRDKIKPIIKEIIGKQVLNPESEIDTKELEKYILSLLEAQKKICADAAYENNGVLLTDDVIKNAPYPVESDLIVLDKLFLKTIIDHAYDYGIKGLTPKEGEERLLKDFDFDIKNLTL